MKRPVWLISGAALFMPTPSLGCSHCALALADRYLPPALGWCLLASIWFIVASWAARGCKNTAGLPGLMGSAAVILIAWVIAFAVTGPFDFIILVLWVACSLCGKLFFSAPADPAPPRVRRTAIGIAVSAIAFGAVSIFVAHRRTNVDFVVKWDGAGPTLKMMRDMAVRGPAGHDELREIIRRGSAISVARSVDLLSPNVDPVRDVPLLLDAFERLTAASNTPPVGGSLIQETLRSWTGLKLPDGASAADWRRAWAAKDKTRQPHARRPPK